MSQELTVVRDVYHRISKSDLDATQKLIATTFAMFRDYTRSISEDELLAIPRWTDGYIFDLTLRGHNV